MQRCLEGGLSKYDPEAGSFRTYLKTVLRRNCYEYARKNAKARDVLQMDTVIAGGIQVDDDLADSAFDQELVGSIFQSSLNAIKELDSTFYTALKLNTEAIANGVKPPTSEELASVLSIETGKPVSRENARKIKSRASKKFSEQIITEVSRLIQTTDLDEIESALIDIGILRYCKKALERMRLAKRGSN